MSLFRTAVSTLFGGLLNQGTPTVYAPLSTDEVTPNPGSISSTISVPSLNNIL